MMLSDFFEGFGFDLADAFAGDAEYLADFFERMRHTVFQAKAHLKNFLFTLGKVAGNFIEVVAQDAARRNRLR